MIGKIEWKVFFNVICSIAGAGVLGIPSAVKLGGWTSVMLIFIGGLICFYTGLLTIECLYSRKKKMKTFAEVGYESYGKIGQIVVQSFQYSVILGAVCLFIIFSATNLFEISNYYSLSVGFKTCYVITVLVIAVPFSVVKTNKEIHWLTIFGVLCTFLSVMVVVVYSIARPMEGVKYETINFKDIPLSLSTISFAFGGSMVFPTIENHLEKKENWTITLFVAILVIVILYAVMGIVGYLIYGDLVMSPIFYNLEKGWVTYTTIILLIFHVLLTSPLFLCTFSLEMENSLGITKEKLGWKKEFVVRFISRNILVMIIGLIAYLAPYFDLIIPLIGAVANGFIMFIVPVVCHLKLYGYKNTNKYKLMLFFIILAFGAVCFIFGTADAIVSLVDRIKKDNLIE